LDLKTAPADSARPAKHTQPKPNVLVRPCDESSVAEAVDRIFDDLAIDPKGKRVLVKPNMVGPFPPERHATTSPAVVAATLAALRKRGASEIVVADNPGRESYGAVMHAARATGILDAADGLFRSIASPVETIEGVCHCAPRLSVSRAVLETDLLISLAKFKTHLLTTLTGAVKNSFGHVVGGAKAQIHRHSRTVERFSEAIVDIYSVRPPDLCIIDGIVAMEGDGPTGKDLRRLNRLIASTDGAAADAVMARLMGVDPAAVDHLRMTAERGLGVIAADAMTVDGDVAPVEGFRLPCTFAAGGAERRRRWFSYIVHNVLFGWVVARAKFRVNDDCTACGTCVEACPVDAVSLEDATKGRTKPRFDYDRCIRCYCCHELCPESAIELHSPLLGRRAFQHFER
jgi:uncharacterized protein (DUF362 family)/Pyruvate/2-oxoacid:ferredoxin oxidoreductase delta subunit